jgi:hypothetical protein
VSPQVWTPEYRDRPGEITINPWSYQSLGPALNQAGQGTPATQNFVTANLAVFIPFWVPEPIVIYKMGWGNGAAVAGNLDCGIYSEAGSKLVSSGSTAASGTSVIQAVDVGDTTLARGRYYLALASDTSGATQKVIAVLPAAGIGQSLGLLQTAAAFALPASVTFAKYASAFVPMVFAQGYRTVGP